MKDLLQGIVTLCFMNVSALASSYQQLCRDNHRNELVYIMEYTGIFDGTVYQPKLKFDLL